MPKECQHEYHDSDEMCRFEEFIAKIFVYQSAMFFVLMVFYRYSPDYTVRSKGKPGLDKECNDASPIEYKIFCKMLLHIMPPNMKHNEWKCVQEREDKEGIGDPSMEDLKSLVRNPR